MLLKISELVMKKKAKGIYGESSSDSRIRTKRELAPGQDATAWAEVNDRFFCVSISDLDTCVEAAIGGFRSHAAPMCCCCLDAYDPMDPDGNITIKWDFMTNPGDTYTVLVSIYNYQLYRHIERPGWRLGWTWPNDEVIWDMRGAEATNQGNCSKFKGDSIPHCCEKSPTIVDLPPGTPYNMQTKNCCRGGVLSSLAQDPSLAKASFQMTMESANISSPATGKPSNFTLGIPGYTCSNATVVAPSKFQVDKQRTTQALMTWEITCSYSQFRESETPSCCVSLSTVGGEQSNFLQLPNGDGGSTTSPALLCTTHMCPIRVHWHVKESYREYWRVKVTITNFDMQSNYSDWNLVIQHPSFRSILQIFSFNYLPLVHYGEINDTGMFWGIKHYNDMLIQYGENGNVQTEMLLHKDAADFTFSGGWAFPRRLSFNGHECVMPPPDAYPTLPNGSSTMSSLVHCVSLGLSSFLLLSVVVLLLL
ncbi:hypothetical protein OPV22_003907 [Ensete ventricosum]|uniref:COBRA-like protein n=1 Tax=Ensete ventricosum TaxID=4639 RepID=A0AAV8S270_ENSVE|nr:hypothetical protein OPV22_003907 [Ensete ventricosum]